MVFPFLFIPFAVKQSNSGKVKRGGGGINEGQGLFILISLTVGEECSTNGNL